MLSHGPRSRRPLIPRHSPLESIDPCFNSVKWPGFSTADILAAVRMRDKSGLSAVAEGVCQTMRSGYEILNQEASPGVFGNSEPPEGIDLEAFGAAVYRSTGGTKLPPGIGCSKLKLTSNRAIKQALGKNFWPGFRAAFPGARGLATFSLPGYSEDGSIAIVIVEMSCDTRCGGGEVWELHKSEEGWSVTKKIPAWIS